MLEMMTATAALLVAYHHVGYPLVLKAARRSMQSQPRPMANRGQSRPHISILVPAHNEADVIARKIENLARLDYPQDLFDITIVCDGCTDNTAEVAAETIMRIGEPPRMRLIVSERNVGKIAVLNAYVPILRGDVVALTDASAMVSDSALSHAADWFSVPDVGVVAGTYEIKTHGSDGEDAYWRYQRAVKEGEAALGAPLGVHGALYFLRKECFQKLPADTINDDFIIPMRAVEAGFRVVYDTEIVGTELEVASDDLDSRRRRRIAAGNMQQLIRMRGLLNPRFGGIAFSFASGKALRVLTPYLMLLFMIGAAVLALEPGLWRWIFAASAIGALTAALRMLFPALRAPKIIDVGTYIARGHLNGLIGGARYLFGFERGAWGRAN